MSLRALIVEDQPEFAQLIENIARAEFPYIEIVGKAETVDEALRMLNDEDPNIVFLDIQLHHQTAFDLLERWLQYKGSIAFEPIFITAEGTFENALRAFRYFAVDFLTKPVEHEKFKSAVLRAEEKIKAKKNTQSITDEDKLQQMMLLLESMRQPDKRPFKLTFQLIGGIYEFISVSDIMYLEADGPITYIHINNQQKPLCAAKNLGHYSSMLVEDYHFFQISQSLIVNLDFIRQYRHNENEIVLTDDRILLASRRGGQLLKDYLTQGGLKKESDGNSLVNKLFQFWKGK